MSCFYKKIAGGVVIGFYWIPLSLLGWAAAPLLAWVLRYYGLQRHDQILLVVGWGGLAATALLAVMTLAASLWLKLRKEPSGGRAPVAGALEFDADSPFFTGYQLPKLPWLPLLRVDIRWQTPANVQIELVANYDNLSEQAMLPGRCWQDEIVRHFRVGDVFGLTRIGFVRRQTQKLRIAPNPGHTAEVRPHVQFQAGDVFAHPQGRPEGDMVEMRNYARGDPLKHVLWKAYARTGRLMVRTPEKAVAPAERLLACLIAGPGDEASAGVARAMLELGLLGRDFLFCADGSQEPTSEVPEAVRQIIRSSNARHRSGESLSALLASVDASNMQACILFLPSLPGDWQDRVVQEVTAAPGRCHALLGVDHLAPQENWWRRVVYRRQELQGTRPAAILKVCQPLIEAGADVMIVDRQSGQTFSPGELTLMSTPAAWPFSRAS